MAGAGGSEGRGKTASSPAHQIIVITEYYAAVSAVQTPWPIKCGYVPNMVNLNFQRARSTARRPRRERPFLSYRRKAREFLRVRTRCAQVDEGEMTEETDEAKESAARSLASPRVQLAAD